MVIPHESGSTIRRRHLGRLDPDRSVEPHSGDVAQNEVPAEIESITVALTDDQPPTNPLVVLKAARWWYLHGTGGTDPAFTWAVEWVRHLATGEPSDSARFDAFCEYLVTVGVVDERHELR